MHQRSKVKNRGRRARCLATPAAANLVVALTLSATPSHSAEVSSLIGGEFRIQGGKGGDVPKLEEAETIEGGLPDLKLGDHFLVGLGVIVSPWSSGRHAAEAELFGGFASWSTGSDSDVNRLTSFGVPLDLLAFYRYRLSADGSIPTFLRAGGGATYHAAWGIGSFGKYGGINYDLDDAFGAVFEASAVYGVIGAGLRYTRISTELSGSNESVNVSSIAAFVNLIVEPGLEM